MPIKEEEKGVELRINEAIRNKLSTVKEEIAAASNKLSPAQHMRFTLNTIDQHINELVAAAKQL